MKTRFPKLIPSMRSIVCSDYVVVKRDSRTVTIPTQNTLDDHNLEMDFG